MRRFQLPPIFRVLINDEVEVRKAAGIIKASSSPDLIVYFLPLVSDMERPLVGLLIEINFTLAEILRDHQDLSQGF